MSIWNAPVAVALKFAANDYVSACTATIDCDLPGSDDWYKFKVDFGKTIPTTKGDLDNLFCSPCGKKHDVGLAGELLSITITEGYQEKDGPVVSLEEPISCYFFVEYAEDGVLKDGHFTMDADGLESNKS